MEKWKVFLMVFISVCLAALLIALILFLQSPGAPLNRRVLIIGLDGTRGDIFYHVVMKTKLGPNVRGLVAEGARLAECNSPYDDNCAKAHDGFETGPSFEWVTSPGWSSVVTGVNNNKTLVRNNDVENQDEFSITSQLYPTVFRRAKEAGLRTAASGTPAFLTALDDDGDDDWGILDYECGLNNSVVPPVPLVRSGTTQTCNLDYRQGLSEVPSADNDTTSFALKLIQEQKVDLIMTHFNNIDEAGHTFGFADYAGYMLNISIVDRLIGKLVAEVKNQAVNNHQQWLVILTSDHGGHSSEGTDSDEGIHGFDWLEDKVVPFMVATFTNKKMTLRPLVNPRHFDTTPTALRWLGLPIPPNLDGRVQCI